MSQNNRIWLWAINFSQGFVISLRQQYLNLLLKNPKPSNDHYRLNALNLVTSTITQSTIQFSKIPIEFFLNFNWKQKLDKKIKHTLVLESKWVFWDLRTIYPWNQFVWFIELESHIINNDMKHSQTSDFPAQEGDRHFAHQRQRLWLRFQSL